MSADLLAAFGEASHAGEHNDQPKDLDKGHEISRSSLADITWQAWPSCPESQSQANAGHDHHSLWRSDGKGTDVLFDADDFHALNVSQNTDDDFGDFEQAEVDFSPATKVQVRAAPRYTTENLLELDDHEQNGQNGKGFRPAAISETRYPRVRNSNVPAPERTGAGTILTDADDDWRQFEGVESAHLGPVNEASSVKPPALLISNLHTNGSTISSPKGSSAAKAQAQALPNEPNPVSDNDFDAWDEIENEPPAAGAQQKSGPIIAQPSLAANKSDARPVRRDRPTNVPPPAVLLSLSAKVWSSLATQARQSSGSEDIGTVAVQAYRVSARIISGRTHRWKRDIILAQSMRIGAAGRSGGMKLTALDKGESRKEEQEVEEVIASWLKYSHILGAAMTKTKVQKPSISLSTKLIIRTATGADVLNASHICPICGIRRNERIKGIDVNTSDTFGEFWIEHWGHTDCHDFWYKYNELLDHR